MRRQDGAFPARAANPWAAELPVDRVGDATLPVGVTVEFGMLLQFIDLLWWIRR